MKSLPLVLEDHSDSIQDIVHLPPCHTYVVGTFNNGTALYVLQLAGDNKKVKYLIRTVGDKDK